MAPASNRTPSAKAKPTGSTLTLRTGAASTPVQGGGCSSRVAHRAWCSAPPANAARGDERQRPLEPQPPPRPGPRVTPRPAFPALLGEGGCNPPDLSALLPFVLALLGCLFYLQNKSGLHSTVPSTVTYSASLSTLLIETGEVGKPRGEGSVRHAEV